MRNSSVFLICFSWQLNNNPEFFAYFIELFLKHLREWIKGFLIFKKNSERRSKKYFDLIVFREYN